MTGAEPAELNVDSHSSDPDASALDRYFFYLPVFYGCFLSMTSKLGGRQMASEPAIRFLLASFSTCCDYLASYFCSRGLLPLTAAASFFTSCGGVVADYFFVATATSTTSPTTSRTSTCFLLIVFCVTILDENKCSPWGCCFGFSPPLPQTRLLSSSSSLL